MGSWALDTSGWDGLTDPVDGSAGGGGTTDGMVDLGLSDLVVSFRKDGTVQIPVEKGVGLQWRVEPGPTHLDTIYFEMIPAAPKVTMVLIFAEGEAFYTSGWTGRGGGGGTGTPRAESSAASLLLLWKLRVAATTNRGCKYWQGRGGKRVGARRTRGFRCRGVT